MNILHIMGSLDQRSGGPLRAVLDLSSAAIPLGLKSELLGFGPLRVLDNPLPVELIHSLPAVGHKAYGYSPRLREWCKANLSRFSGVVLHGMWSYGNWAVSRECRAAGMPYICFPHGMLDIWSVHGQGVWKRMKKISYWHWRERNVVAGSRAVLFTTPRELRHARMTFDLPTMHPLVVVPYGMSPAAAAVDASSPVNREIDQPAGTKVALFLGRVHPKKRPDLLIRAWARASVPPEWRLVIAGPGEQSYLKHLAELAAQCGLSNSVQFTGPVAGNDKHYLLNRAAWFLLPSEQENFGIAVLEAVANKCAVAISDQVYLGDDFPEGSEILPLQLETWTRFLRDRMTDEKWRQSIIRETSAKLEPIFNIDRITRGWVDTIKGILGGTALEN